MVATHAPTTLAVALGLLTERSGTLHPYIPFSGGTDLMVSEERNRDFLFLSAIPELRSIEDGDDSITLGAALSYNELLKSDLVPDILKEAVATIAGPAIRNTATLGGNIANASPKADGALICVVADALLKLASSDAERIVPLQDFYRGRGKTILRPDELLTQIVLPKRYLANYEYCKVGGRKALAISRVSFAGLFSRKGERIEHIALAFGAIEDVIVRRPEIDEMLIGKTIPEALTLKEKYLAAYNAAINPIRGRVSAEYRKLVCLNLIDDFLQNRLRLPEEATA